MKESFLRFAALPLFLAVFAFFSCDTGENGSGDPGDQVEVTGIKIEPEGKILTVGAEFQLTATLSPSNATDRRISWESSHPEVASVSETGLVKALSAGIASITVTALANGKKAQCMITVNAGDTPGPGPGPEPATGLRFRTFSSDQGGIATAVDVGDEVPYSAAMGYNRRFRIIFYVSEADDGVPLADEVASHYTMSIVDATSGAVDLEAEHVGMMKLSGVDCGVYVLHFLDPGTATVNLKYDNGAGKSLDKTVKVTLEGAPHELEFRWGVGSFYTVAQNSYEAPVDLSAYASGGWTFWVRAFDKSLNRELRNGTFSFDPDNDDPDSNALFEGNVQSPSTAYPDLEVFRIDVQSRGHAGIGLRYEGEFGTLRQTVHFFSPLTLELSETPTNSSGTYFSKDELELTGTKYLYLIHPDREKSIAVAASEMKLTGGDASIAELKLSDDAKSLVFTPKKIGTTTWKISYAYYGTTLERSIKVTVKSVPAPGSLRFRWYADDMQRADAQDLGSSVSYAVALGIAFRINFFVTEDGTDPVTDPEASHYSYTGLEDPAGVIDSEFPIISVGTKGCSYILRFIKTGTAKLTLQYNNGAGTSLSQTVTVTLSEKAHDLSFRYGSGESYVSAYNPYEGPVNISYGYIGKDLRIRVVDNSFSNRPYLSDAHYAVDADLTDPYSTMDYEGGVVTQDGVTHFCFKLKSCGYLGIGLKYENGEYLKIKERLCFSYEQKLYLGKSVDNYVSQLNLELGESQSLYFIHPESKKTIRVKPDLLKITGGDSSIATVALAKDEKTLTFTPKKEGTTTWKVSYSYMRTTMDESVQVVVSPATVPVTSLSWDSKESELEIGKRITFSVKIEPSNATYQTASWSSSVAGIVQIDPQPGRFANVTGLKAGTTVITASCGGKSIDCTVKVLPEARNVRIDTKYDTSDPEYVQSAEVLLTQGENYTLKASVLGVGNKVLSGAKVKWQSENPNVVTVIASTGVVLTGSGGTTVSGSSVNAVKVWAISEENPDAKDYINVRVYDKPTSITCTSMSTIDNKYVKPKDSRELKFQILPSTARQRVVALVIPSTYGTWTCEPSTTGPNATVTCPAEPYDCEDYYSYSHSFVFAPIGARRTSSGPNVQVNLWACEFYASDVKPYDYVYYNKSTGKLRSSDGGLRSFHWNKDAIDKYYVAPSPTSSETVIAVITQVASAIADTKAQSDGAFTGLSNNSRMHGFAIALDLASSSTKWSDNKDDVASNWPSGYTSPYVSGDIWESKYVNAYELTQGGMAYNASRGSKSKIKPVELIAQYASSHPAGKISGSAYDVSHWVVPTFSITRIGNGNSIEKSRMYHWDNVHGDKGRMNALNQNITACGGVTYNSEYWSINVLNSTLAWSVVYFPGGTGTSGAEYYDKTKTKAVRPWLVF